MAPSAPHPLRTVTNTLLTVPEVVVPNPRGAKRSSSAVVPPHVDIDDDTVQANKKTPGFRAPEDADTPHPPTPCTPPTPPNPHTAHTSLSPLTPLILTGVYSVTGITALEP